jgi:hypothetical protein
VRTKVLDPIRAFVKVADCCDPCSASTLTCIKPLETFCESAFATVPEQFTIMGYFICFGEDG